MRLNEGTKVSIIDGEFKGGSAVVVGYHDHGFNREPPITYAVMLDTPVTKTVSKAIDLGGGRKGTMEEEVTFTRVEVEEAHVK